MANDNPNPASMAPHLLTIPREIRDIIYSHLARPLSMHWTYSDSRIYMWMPRTVRFRVEHAPRLSVLLTHTRLYEEYLDFAFHKNLSATIHVGDPLSWFKSRHPVRLGFDSGPKPQVPHEVLANLRHLTIFDSVGGQFSSALCDGLGVQAVITTLASKVPHLSTMRIALRREFFLQKDQLERICSSFETTKPVDPTPTTLAGLRLEQRAVAYRITHFTGSYDLGTWENYYVEVGCYAYARDAISPRSWVPHDVYHDWAQTPYYRAASSDDITTACLDPAWCVKDWKEMRRNTGRPRHGC
ncbi:Nn.00g039820.m01.CDS01 [Neocucurbitaria sp. VM-36]